MPAILTAHSERSWITVLEAIGAPTTCTTEDQFAAIPHQPPEQQHRQYYHINHLRARDPGASDPKFGGAIIAVITGSILIAVGICLCRRRRRKDSFSPPPSPQVNTHKPRPPAAVDPSQPKIVILPPTQGQGEIPEHLQREKPTMGFVRRKPPKARLGSFRPPPQFEASVPLPPGAHRPPGGQAHAPPEMNPPVRAHFPSGAQRY